MFGLVKNSMPLPEAGRHFDPDLVPRSPGGISWSIQYQPSVTSTQDLAREAARAGAAEGWTIVTDWQEAGRGRLGHAWQAAAGLDLLFSCVLRPSPALLSLLPLLAGLAVADGVVQSTEIRVDLKWPNDLLVGQRKLAGILLERSAVDGVVLGVGMNVNTAAAALPPLATSVAVALGREVGRERLLGAILAEISAAVDRVIAEGDSWVVASWRRRSSMLGRRVTYLDRDTTRGALAEDIRPDGALTVRLDDGTRRHLYAGDVQLVRPQS